MIQVPVLHGDPVLRFVRLWTKCGHDDVGVCEKRSFSRAPLGTADALAVRAGAACAVA